MALAPPEARNSDASPLQQPSAPAEPVSEPADGDAVSRLPSHKSGPPETIWNEFFRQQRPADHAVRRTVLRLTELGEHEHVIHLLQAAIIHGQSQPWMYTVLGESMQHAGRPEAEVQRVVLSMSDFGSASVESMLISGAYLTRFGRDDAALRMYHQAARMQPERAEPYVLALRIARKLKRADDVAWAATGVLQYGWTEEAEAVQREAQDAALEAEEWLTAAGNEAAAAELKRDVAQAMRRDLKVVLTWNGTADLDLLVEEPVGTVCSFDNAETIGGGIHLHDGYGPVASNCIETYVCPLAVNGEYTIRVRHVFGQVVGKRAQLTITSHAGSPEEAAVRQTIVLSEEDSVIRFKLEGGRREHPRTVSSRWLNPIGNRQLVEATPDARADENLRPDEAAALQRFREGRELRFQHVAAQTTRPFLTGAVGFQPVVTNLNEGAVVTANAVVSPDRRYVRIAINPQFTTLTDVFTFSFVSGVDPFGGRNTGLGGN